MGVRSRCVNIEHRAEKELPGDLCMKLYNVEWHGIEYDHRILIHLLIGESLKIYVFLGHDGPLLPDCEVYGAMSTP